MTFTTGPAWRHSRPISSPARRAVVTGSAFETTTARANLVASRQHEPSRAAVLDQDALDRRLEPHACAGRLSGAAQRRRHGAHAPARVSPRAWRPRRLAEVVVEADEGGARFLRPRERPDQTLDRERDTDLLRRDVRELLRDRAIEDPLADGLEPALAIGRLEHERPRPLGGPLPAIGELAVPGRVGGGPVALDRLAGLLAPGPRHNLAAIRERREQIRIVDGHRQPVRGEVELAHDLRPQERQRVRARRCAHARPELLRHAGAADDVAALKALHREPGTCQVRGGDQAVMAGADDGDVEHLGRGYFLKRRNNGIAYQSAMNSRAVPTVNPTTAEPP